MKIQDKIKDTFDKCAKIKFEGDSNDHPIIYLNILKNIIGDNKEKPSNTLMNKMIEISEEYPPRDKDEIFLSEIASEGLGMTVAVADLQDACQNGNWEEAKKVAARLQHVSENGLGLIEALIELSLQDLIEWESFLIICKEPTHLIKITKIIGYMLFVYLMN